jgi:rubrerythrin
MSVARKILIRGSRGMIAMALATSLTPPQLLAAPTDAVSTKTMQNLQSALNGERNAHSRYLAFAEKADQEGYGAIASLFRAAGAAEEVHGNNHEQTIQM